MAVRMAPKWLEDPRVKWEPQESHLIDGFGVSPGLPEADFIYEWHSAIKNVISPVKAVIFVYLC